MGIDPEIINNETVALLMAIPPIFTCALVTGKYLFDGGVLFLMVYYNMMGKKKRDKIV